VKINEKTKTKKCIGAALALAIGAILATASVAYAEHTRRWKQSTYEEFLKGTTHGVAVRSDGRLELAPKFTQLADADASYLWAVKLDSKGTPYAAGGSPAKVIRLDANGKTATVFQSTDLSAQAIAFDAKGALYVGTSPDGKVYKVLAGGEKTVFFEPKTKYIWDLAFAADGTLYVATGDKGQIYAVAPDGKSELFYSSDEAHIRVLAFDGQGNLIAGTEPSGRVLRVTKKSAKPAEKEVAADGFVLYETPKREVTALSVGADGTIYAAAIGERQHNAAVSTPLGRAEQGVTVTTTGNVTVIGAAQGAAAQQFGFTPQVSGGIYKIAASGAPEEIWSSREDVVYALGMAQDGRLLAGTGNNGALLAIDGRGVFAQLAKAGSSQITGIARNAAGKIFLCTANPGKVVTLGPEYEPEGTYESRSFDAQLFSQWGRMEWWSPPATNGTKAQSGDQARLEFYVRTGNTEDPGKEWSKWFGPYSKPGTPVEAPAARFVQWKAVIHDGRPGDGIDWVSVAYLPKNVAPVIDGIAVQEPGVKVTGAQIISGGQPTPVNLKMPPTPGIGGIIQSQNITTSNVKFDAPPQGFSQKGFQSVLWTAHDDNDDDLRYAVYFRGEDEKEWKLLKDNLEQRFYAFDTTSLADGAYYLKIVASDAASNDAARSLAAEKESERFEVDNTPPVVEGLHATVAITCSGSICVHTAVIDFTARDSATAIEKAEYSLDGGEWKLILPESGISDAPVEKYQGGLPALAAGEHTVAVRAFDRFENVGSAKVTFQVAGGK
jgi:outer membrane protein assembly factor BamB